MRYLIDKEDLIGCLSEIVCPDDGECRTRAERDDKHPEDCLQCHLQNGTVEEEQGWISVEDGLPKSGKTVLATYKNEYGMNRRIVGHYLERFKEETCGEYEANDEYSEEHDAYFYKEGWYEQLDNWEEYGSVAVYMGKVTHWMPLPEPPKGRN